VNARDAMPQGGQLTLETRNVEVGGDPASGQPTVPPGAYVLLTVADTGSGMDDHTRERVFEPFFTTKGERGTGLGLATVYGIVAQSGGHIDVESEPDKGSMFRIYLPRCRERPTTGKSHPGVATERHGSETLLLVEDEDGVRQLACLVLRQSGYRVLEARSGGDALLTCERHPEPIQLLVTDVVMPQMSGRQLAERLAVMRPQMRVLYLSGYTDEALAQHGVLDPETAFLAKPFHPAALARKVREVLDSVPGDSLP
jgi:CheY-like chemotaxis protein